MKQKNIFNGIFAFGVFLMHILPLNTVSTGYTEAPYWSISIIYLIFVCIISLAVSAYNFATVFGEE